MGIIIKQFHVGNAIAKRLKEKGLTQRAFSEKLGVAQQEVTRLLRKNSLDTEKLSAICVILDYNFFKDFCAIGTTENSASIDAVLDKVVKLGVENNRLQETIKEKEEYIQELEGRLAEK
ncbi:MAG: helix-turn-helix transcriptional regulator [Treponema sp.]|nr:helix-turn-helix transcriptional regulator [Treponema sp.]